MNNEEQAKFVLRLSPKLHKQLKKSAKIDATSMNQQVVKFIQAGIKPDQSVPVILKRIEKRLEDANVI